MADFRINTGFFRHHKVRKVERRGGLEAVLAVLRLWAYAAEFRTKGDLAGMTSEDIELAAGWNSEVPFVSILVEVGFLDEGADGYALHDWQEHNPWVAESEDRSASARLSRLHRENPVEAARLKAEGRTGLTSEEYNTFKRNTVVERSLTNRTTPTPAPAPAPEPDPRKEKEDCPEPCPASGPEAAAFSFPIVGKDKIEPIYQHELDDWQTLFPALDVPQAVRECLAWNQANPTRRKTPAGLRKHIVSWLSKEQNSGRHQGSAPALPGSPEFERQLAELRALSAKRATITPDSTAPRPVSGLIAEMQKAAKNSTPMPDFVRQKFLEGKQ